MNLESISNLINKTESLPSIWGLAGHLLGLLGDEQVSVEEISQLIEIDPGLSLRVLKLVNSAYFSPAAPVHTISRAINLLGLNTIYSIVTGLAVMKTVPTWKNNSILTSSQFWSHSFRCAIAAKYIASQVGYLDENQAYLAGLIHDVGKMSLLEHALDNYLLIHQQAEAENAELTAIELEKLGFTHADVSALLVMKWNLGEEMSEVVAAHHYPEDYEHIQNLFLALILYLANQLCYVDNPGVASFMFESLNAYFLEVFPEFVPAFDAAFLREIIVGLQPLFKECDELVEALVFKTDKSKY